MHAETMHSTMNCMNPEQFVVLQVSSFEMGTMPKTLGKHHTWGDAVAQVFDAANRKNMVIAEFSPYSKNHHTFWFNEDGLVVSVDHFCNGECCKYDALESLNR